MYGVTGSQLQRQKMNLSYGIMIYIPTEITEKGFVHNTLFLIITFLWVLGYVKHESNEDMYRFIHFTMKVNCFIFIYFFIYSVRSIVPVLSHCEVNWVSEAVASFFLSNGANDMSYCLI